MLLTCTDLTLGYNANPILKNLNFHVTKGDYLCILGENGSGKTTLMKAILGLHAPMSGKITFGDQLKATQIGYLPQQTTMQKDFPASVKEIVLSGCQGRCGMRPFYNAKEKQLAKDAMSRMSITTFQHCSYRKLSGGQQQRVLLARALCATQTMLLLDEPVSGLDPKVSAEMYQLIHQLNKDGITIIMISHDIFSALKYATTVLHIEKETVFFGLKDNYLQSRQGTQYLQSGGGLSWRSSLKS